MSEHTPGPWVLEENAPGFIRTKNIVRTGPGGFDFIQASNEADARLIAAAPDLLDALGGLHRAVLQYLLEDIGRGSLMGAVDDAEAAMAKARGTP